METVDGKCALISGGAGGIGFGIAEALAKAGARIVLADIDAQGAAAAAARLTECGHQVIATPLDVTDPNSWTKAADEAERRFGNIHVFCNNAGVSGTPGQNLEDLSERDWVWVRRINLDGALHGLQCLVPRLKQHGEAGHIVNTGSMASVLTFPQIGDYAATKRALAAISETLRLELASAHIGVSLLCPGLVRTGIMQNSKRARAALADGAAIEEAPDYDAGTTSGIEPAAVGELVLQAILANRAYIFTHPELAGMVEDCFKAILDDFTWSRSQAKAK